MLSRRWWFASLVVAVWLLAAVPSRGAETEDWPGWRGPRGDGSSQEAGVPTEWDGAEGKNIAWKTALPGSGHSSPIVWGDRVFVASCLPDSKERVLVSLDRKSGAVLWQKAVFTANLEGKHSLNSYASGTPATDGQTVYVSFLAPDTSEKLGNRERNPGDLVVAAYDFAGEQKWVARPGRFASVHGFCSSPLLFENLVLINGDHDGESYLAALDKTTGKTVWKTLREHRTRSYCTPIVREIDGRTQMLLSGSKCVASYDPRTGAKHWELAGPTEQFVASCVYDGSLLYLTAGFPEKHILAVDPTGKGKLGDDSIKWRTTKGCSYVPSPVLSGDYLLVAADVGTGVCFHARTGEQLWLERMGKHYSASLVAAGGLVYFLADDGITKVVRPGAKLEVVAENKLGEYCYASPAISRGQLFIRGEKHLYCIGAGK